MWSEMVKTYRLELWEKDTEGAITPVLYILYGWVMKLDIRGGIIAGVKLVTNNTPSP